MRLRHFLLALAVTVFFHLLLSRLVPVVPRALDLFFVLTVLNALAGRSLRGLLGGTACGLIHDALSGAPYGLHGFADSLVGYVTARVAQRLVTRRFTSLLLILVMAAVLQQAVLLLIGVGLAAEPNLPDPLWVALRAIISSLVGLSLDGLSRRVQHQIAETRRTRRSRLRLE
jgi:rod shape-determining protein MreD